MEEWMKRRRAVYCRQVVSATAAAAAAAECSADKLRTLLTANNASPDEKCRRKSPGRLSAFNDVRGASPVGVPINHVSPVNAHMPGARRSAAWQARCKPTTASGATGRMQTIYSSAPLSFSRGQWATNHVHLAFVASSAYDSSELKCRERRGACFASCRRRLV